MIRLFAAASLCALAACASGPKLPTGGTCSAGPAQFVVGQPYDASTAEQARQASGARTVRQIEPGRAYTMEFSAQRLNLVTDATGKVTEARCG
jgi:hypothetical protein